MSVAATPSAAATRCAASRLAVPDCVVSGARRARRARSDRRTAGGCGAAHPRLRARRGVPQGRVQLHGVVAAPDRARPGRRLPRRPAADRHRGGCHRSGRGAGAGLRRRHRADRAVAHCRRLRVRHRHAARQRLRLRHALHGRRRLRPHDDHARLLHRRQRDRQPAPAGLPAARRHRSDPGLELFRTLGRPRRHMGKPRAGGADRHRHRQAARRVVRAVAKDRVRRDR